MTKGIPRKGRAQPGEPIMGDRHLGSGGDAMLMQIR